MKDVITDRAAIRMAIWMPKSTPESFIPKELKPVGSAFFIGDSLGIGWSVNPYFKIGETYPVYDYEGEFVIGNNGMGFKLTPNAWYRVKN
jgi:hypothetical protein